MNPPLLHEAFLVAANRFPARVAVSRGDDLRTFGEIAAAVPVVARELAARGVSRGDLTGGRRQLEDQDAGTFDLARAPYPRRGQERTRSPGGHFLIKGDQETSRHERGRS